MSDEMKVERLNVTGWMTPSDNGQYVRYTDYTALQQQLAAAREALQAKEADAARWDFARKFISGDDVEKWEKMDRDGHIPSEDGNRQADYYIDAAIAATLQRDRQP